jgi:hypothetical protein
MTEDYVTCVPDNVMNVPWTAFTSTFGCCTSHACVSQNRMRGFHLFSFFFSALVVDVSACAA